MLLLHLGFSRVCSFRVGEGEENYDASAHPGQELRGQMFSRNKPFSLGAEEFSLGRGTPEVKHIPLHIPLKCSALKTSQKIPDNWYQC